MSTHRGELAVAGFVVTAIASAVLFDWPGARRHRTELPQSDPVRGELLPVG